MEVAGNGAEGEDAWPGAQKLNMAQEILDINKCVTLPQSLPLNNTLRSVEDQALLSGWMLLAWEEGRVGHLQYAQAFCRDLPPNRTCVGLPLVVREFRKYHAPNQLLRGLCCALAHSCISGMKVVLGSRTVLLNGHDGFGGSVLGILKCRKLRLGQSWTDKNA